MDTEAILLRLGISLGLGLLVGLQKERSESKLGGIRTFPLITLLGTLAGLLAQNYGGSVVTAGFLAMTALVVLGNFAAIKAGRINPGLTTEVAMLAMFGVGAYLALGPPSVAIVLGSAIAVLLFLKPQMHAMARGIGARDLTAIMQFVVISLVVLPVLPDRAFDPYGVLNPFRIWLMVVLIVGISLTGYIIYKFAGHSTGTLVAGILGGLISSTATTASYARRSREIPETRSRAIRVIVIASTIVFLRVIFLVAVTGRSILPVIAPPVAIMAAVLCVLSFITSIGGAAPERAMPEQKNPSELGAAILFGGLYAAVLLAIAAAREHLGITGIYAVSVLSGLTDMDAITLSVTGLALAGKITASEAWRAVLTASMANIVFKAGIVAVLGGWRLFLKVALLFAIACAAGAFLLTFWPAG